jgi:hypothetical protein
MIRRIAEGLFVAGVVVMLLLVVACWAMLEDAVHTGIRGAN